ncbi:MAG TPA: AMP-binding protein [Acidimicrobiales bacterium]|nr:AMP-binding protein [Acidimicrobiales bacterium]
MAKTASPAAAAGRRRSQRLGPVGEDIRRWVAQGADERPAQCFLKGARDDRTVTYSQLATLAATLTAHLVRIGAPSDGPIAVSCEDYLDYAAAFVALLAAGRTVVPLDPRAPAPELRRTMALTGTVATISRTGLFEDGAGPIAVVVDVPAGRSRRSSGRARTGLMDLSPDGAATNGSEGAVLLSTSGTTGAPKVVRLGEAQLVHVARGIAFHHRLTPAERGFSPLPLFHVNAEVVALLATLAGQAGIVLDDKFHRTRFWENVARHGATWVNAVPAIITILATAAPLAAASEEVRRQVRANVRFVRSASAPLPAATFERFEAVTGLRVVESYGMTEAASMITANPVDGVRKPGSVGPPVGCRLRVVDRSGRLLPSGEVGLIEVRGNGVITGYAVGGEDAFTPDGWLSTSDLGYQDEDGYVFLVGRADDVVNRGGENIYPREVEEVLLADPQVRAAVVVGLPDPVLGAVPVAYVVAPGLSAPRHAQLVAALESRCRAELNAFKVPVATHVVDNLPVGPTGKVSRRRALVELASATPL